MIFYRYSMECFRMNSCGSLVNRKDGYLQLIYPNDSYNFNQNYILLINQTMPNVFLINMNYYLVLVAMLASFGVNESIQYSVKQLNNFSKIPSSNYTPSSFNESNNKNSYQQKPLKYSQINSDKPMLTNARQQIKKKNNANNSKFITRPSPISRLEQQSSVLNQIVKPTLNNYIQNPTIIENKQKAISLLIVGRIYRSDNSFNFVKQATSILAERLNPQFYFNDVETLTAIIKQNPQYKAFQFNFKEHQNKIDYFITIGGDGTILYSAQKFINKIPPLLTFQAGYLGVMCRFPIASIQKIISNLVSYHLGEIQSPFQQANIMRLEVNIQKKKSKSVIMCLNEVLISRQSERILLSIYVNDQYLTKTKGDGILVSTPTAYSLTSLSYGGPIIQSQVNCILIVPIGADSLSFRPICISSKYSIKIKLHKNSRGNGRVSFDRRQEIDLNLGDQIIINRAKHDAVFLQQKKTSGISDEIQKIRNILGWNRQYKPMKSSETDGNQL